MNKYCALAKRTSYYIFLDKYIFIHIIRGLMEKIQLNLSSKKIMHTIDIKIDILIKL